MIIIPKRTIYKDLDILLKYLICTNSVNNSLTVLAERVPPLHEFVVNKPIQKKMGGFIFYEILGNEYLWIKLVTVKLLKYFHHCE